MNLFRIFNAVLAQQCEINNKVAELIFSSPISCTSGRQTAFSKF